MRAPSILPRDVFEGLTRKEVQGASVMDSALAEQAAHAGRMLEIAYKNGDREAALIWQRAMFDLVKLRRVRRFGTDTQGKGANLGG